MRGVPAVKAPFFCAGYCEWLSLRRSDRPSTHRPIGRPAARSRRLSRPVSRLFLAVWLGALLLALASAACAPANSAPTSTATAVTSSDAATLPIRIVAAENFYGDLASQIGGNRVAVVSILKDPNVDPHEYESSVDDARAIADARVVIENGAGYDAFVDKLLSASPRPRRIVIDVSQLTGHSAGDNPHFWYDPTTMPRVARRLFEVLIQIDPADRGYFSQRLQAFDASE